MISFNEKTNTFRLDTPDSTYAICISRGWIGHSYYGKKVGDDDLTYLTRCNDFFGAYTPVFREKHTFLDFFPQELPTEGLGDFRESALAISNSENRNGVELKYVSHKIFDGANPIEGLPAVFADKSECKTLEITTFDAVLGVEVVLVYTVFEKINAIVRHTRIINKKGTAPVFIKKALSACIDMDNQNFDVLTLHGSWARERHIERHPVHLGKQGVVSMRGETSHQEHCFMAILDKNADENNGNVYGFNFIYSGNFVADAQLNQFNNLRVVMGINSENFCWKLNPGETFNTPQAVLTFSDKGLNKMSQTFHDLYREHLIRSEYKKQMRPILINNWEATYFDFNTEKLIDIARKAKENGIEMLVMDDGWFGKRDNDRSGLGDWTPNEKKLGCSIGELGKEIRDLGLRFGIWFEPETISEDSDLFRAHPGWAVQVPGREPSLCRYELLLDMSRADVQEYLISIISKVLSESGATYLKWDFNRNLCDKYTASLRAERQGEFAHRFVLGTYRVLENLLTRFPELLIEGCSSGGARFDYGMLYYTPQIWTSDDTDPIERLSIQYGTSFFYPTNTMGAHVSASPNHQTGRATPIYTRAAVAMSGTFGYELDPNKLSEEEKESVREEIQLFDRLNPLIREGDYFRLTGAKEDCVVWEVVSKDGAQALITAVYTQVHPNQMVHYVRPQGLLPEQEYEISLIDNGQTEKLSGQEKALFLTEKTMTGKALQARGIYVPNAAGDYSAWQILLTARY